MLRQQLAEENAWSYYEPYQQFLQVPAATAAAGARFTIMQYSYAPDTLYCNAPLEFDALAFEHNHPSDTLEVRYSVTHLPTRQTILVYGAAGQTILQRYRTRILYAADSCFTLQILGPR